MTSYAKIVNGKVVNLIVCSDEEVVNLEGTYIKVEDSRGRAVIDGLYDDSKDKFIDIQPHPSWILNENDEWESPIGPNPDILTKKWNEETQEWVDRS